MKVTAKVEMTLEVVLSQPWEENSPASQIAKQAKDSAIISVNSMLKDVYPYIHVIGEPRVKMIVTDLGDEDRG